MIRRLLSAAMLMLVLSASAQNPCVNTAKFRVLGFGPNIFGALNNRLNPLSYDSTTKSLLFIHRSDPFSGSGSGDLLYDLSVDTGNTWITNQGVLNPTNNANNGARYPQVVNHHPSGGSAISNNYAVYYAPTVGSTWNGYVSGVRKLDNTVNTEVYNQVGNLQNTLIPGGLCKGTNTAFWTVDAEQTATTGVYASLRVMKGSWNAGNVTWALKTTLVPASTFQMSDWNIAFDPSGKKGWICFISRLTGFDAQYTTIFYNTIDGGNTWNGPIEVDLSSLPAIASLVPAGYYPTTAFQSDMAVDQFGNPHVLVQCGSGDGSAYSIITTNAMAMYDIHYTGSAWDARYLSTAYGLRGKVGNSVETNTHDSEPQMSRSLNGDILSFSWTDTYGAVGGENLNPDFYTVYYSATNGEYSDVYDYTSCTSEAGLIYFPRVAPTMIRKGGGKYQLPVVYTRLGSSGSELDPVKYVFMDDIYVDVCSFAPVVPTFNTSGSVAVCQGDTTALTTTLPYKSYLWSNGYTGSTLYTTTSGNYTVTVTNGSGCKGSVGPKNVQVQQSPTVSISANGNLSFCTGGSVSLVSTASSGVSYQWKKNNVNIAGAVNSSYSANTTGSYTCKVTNTCGTKVSNALSAVKNTTPTATVSPSPSVSICAGDTAVLTANTVNNASYQWLKGSSTIAGATTKTYKALVAGNYKVRITSSAGCSATSTATVVSVNCREGEPGMESAISFYPNPANNELTIVYHEAAAGRELVITNLLGQVVYREIITAEHMETIQVSDWEAGIYFVNVISDVPGAPQKLMITH